MLVVFVAVPVVIARKICKSTVSDKGSEALNYPLLKRLDSPEPQSVFLNPYGSLLCLLMSPTPARLALKKA